MGTSKKLKASKRANAKLERRLAKALRRIEDLHERLAQREAEVADLLARLEPPDDGEEATTPNGAQAESVEIVADDVEPDAPAASDADGSIDASQPTRRRRASAIQAEQVAVEK